MGAVTSLLYFYHFWFSISLTFFPSPSICADTLTQTQFLRTNQTLLSSKGIFELGFYSYTNSTWYLGIWYKNIDNRIVVWVANRDTSLKSPTGFLQIGDKGNILLIDQSLKPIWSSNQTTPARNPILKLLDSGNLVLKEANENDPTKFLWQSFDYPTDTLLPGMKLGWNLDTGIERHITSWRMQDQDPSTGDYSFKLDSHGLPEIFLWNKDKIMYRSGPWNGERFSGVPEMLPVTDSIKFIFHVDEHEAYYTYSIGSQSLFSRLFVSPIGELQRLTRIQSTQIWNKFWYAPKDQCDYYRMCGPYGICDTDASPVCQCVKGFHPKNQQAWNLRDGSDGCVRNTKLDCRSDKFLQVQNVKLPETTTVFVNRSMGLLECGELCHRNCSCTAYANIEITNGGIGCVMWSGELTDMRLFPSGGQGLFVRVAASDVGNHWTWQTKVIIAAVIAGLLTICCFICKLSRWQEKSWLPTKSNQDIEAFLKNHGALTLKRYKFSYVKKMTNSFKVKIGQGGFGAVYKGKLLNGSNVAVKILNPSKGNGEEFINEVASISSTSHVNVVTLLGFCLEGRKKVLIYEFMSNGSLDKFIYKTGHVNTPSLSWDDLYQIAIGIARGLEYLHRGCNTRILHFDIKPHNILLDENFCPKISDFGLAKLCPRKESLISMSDARGTIGYVAPEVWNRHFGRVSHKSDVYSYGMMLLEIVGGRKNINAEASHTSEIYFPDWIHRRLEQGTQLGLDEGEVAIEENEVIEKMTVVGLWCIQTIPNDRPTMSRVVDMLEGSMNSLEIPPRPVLSSPVRSVVESSTTLN